MSLNPGLQRILRELLQTKEKGKNEAMDGDVTKGLKGNNAKSTKSTQICK